MTAPRKIPSWHLYGEDSPFPDLLHIERIADRAAGLDWRIAAHRHLHLHQVFLILSGQVQVTLDGLTSIPEPPVLMNIPRGTVHGFAFSAGTEGHVLTLPAGDFPELFAAPSETRALLSASFVAAAPPGVAETLDAISVLYARPDPLRRLRLRAAALSLCCAVTDAAGPAGRAVGKDDARMARFEVLVRSQFAAGWRLPDYARALAISDRHLRRLCLEATGLSAHAFIEALRLREACRLLAYTRMQVLAVGFAVGFDDPAYFARAFRRGTGFSPGAYRARLET